MGNPMGNPIHIPTMGNKPMIPKPLPKTTPTNNIPTMPTHTPPDQPTTDTITKIIEKATPPKPTNKRKTKLRTWTFKKLKTETTRQIRRNSNIPTYTEQAKLLQQEQPLTPNNVAILMQIAADEATKTSRQNVKTKLNELQRRLDNLTNGQPITTKITE